MINIGPNEAYLGQPDVAYVELYGKSWPIPLLTPRQQRTVLPAAMRLTKYMLKAAQMSGAVGSEALVSAMPELTEADYDDLITVVYGGLKQAHGGLLRSEVEDTAVELGDLFKAYRVVCEQTGIMRRKEGGDSGEARATPQPSPPTGTELSPE